MEGLAAASISTFLTFIVVLIVRNWHLKPTVASALLTLEGADERYYQVIRRIRNSAELEIRDFETNRKLSKTREDAQRWLTQASG